MKKNVLIFAPFGSWIVHHQVDAVLGAALKLRGCEVRALCCDGLFEQCYIAGNPFNPANCAGCARSAVHLFSKFHLPILQLRSLLTNADLRPAREWAESVPVAKFLEAMHEGCPIGQWVALAMNGYFKTSRPDFSRDDVVQMNRNLLYNGVVIQRAYQKLVADSRPDHIICYNGSHPYYRVFFELARQDGIDVLVHERGAIDDSFLFLNNRSTFLATSMEFEEAKAWMAAPLDKSQWSSIRGLMSERELGKNNNFLSFINFTSDCTSTRARLRIPADAPLVALFGSSDWEIGMLKSHGGTQTTFDSQEEWIRQTAEICRDAGFYLAIRHHPLLAGTSSYPRASDFLQDLFRFNRTLASHVRVIMPSEKISSYDLIWDSDVAVTSFSTIGGECLVRGLSTICVADSHLKAMGMDWVQGKSKYADALVGGVSRTRDFGIAELRQAYRYAHFRYFVVNSYRFKSFGIKNVYEADIRIRSFNDLAEGSDPTLDRVLSHILTGTSLYELPRAQVDEQEERRLLEQEFNAIRKRRERSRRQILSHGLADEVPVHVLRIRQDGVNACQNSIFYQSLRRSRWKRWEFAQIPLRPSDDAASFAVAVADAAHRVNTEYIYIGNDNTHLDESALSSAVSIMSDSSHASFDGVVLGVYWCDPNGKLTDELFTELQGGRGFDDMAQRMPALAHPAQLLSLVVWRTAALRAFAARCCESRFASLRDMAAALYGLVFAASGTFYKMKVPAVTIYARLSPDETASQGVELLKTEKPGEALLLLDTAKVSGTSLPDLNYARAVAKARLGRVREAYLSAETEIFRNQDHLGAWNLIRLLLPHMLQAELNYTEIAQPVEKVEGFLVPGQEEFLFNKVRFLPHDAVVLEIGGCYGRSTVAMAFACAGTQRRIFTIDTFFGNDGAMGRNENFLDIWYANLSKLDLERYVMPLSGLSHEILARWDGKPRLDFVFIDGSHEYADVHRDFEMVYPLVKDGGWIALHDVEPGWPGPWRVWRQTARRLLGSHEYCFTLAFGQKEPHRQFHSFSEAHYSYGRDWAEYLQTVFPQIRFLTDAMLLTAQSYYHASLYQSGSELSALKPVEKIIGQMPEVLKQMLRDMLSKEAATDGLLHYWNALVLCHEGRLEGAAEELKMARKLCETGFRARVDALLNDNGS